MTSLTDTEIQDIRESYSINDGGSIRNPGKFEGEQLWVAVAYEESGYGCWELAGADNGDSYSEYTSIGPGAELEIDNDVPTWGASNLREIQETDWQVWLALGVSPDARALILHTDSQGFVTGEQATSAELEAWLERMERETAIHCPYCGEETDTETDSVDDDEYHCPNGHVFTLEETF